MPTENININNRREVSDKYGHEMLDFVSSYKHIFVYQNETIKISGEARFDGDFKRGMAVSDLLLQLQTFTFSKR